MPHWQIPGHREGGALPFQAMMYRALLSGFAEACSSCMASGLFTLHMLDPKRELSRQVDSCLVPCG